MTRRPRHPFATAATLFLVAGTVAQVGIAGVYHRGAERLHDVPSIRERDARIMARPRVVALGDALAPTALVEHLATIGYYESVINEPASYRLGGNALSISARYPEIGNFRIAWRDGVVSSISTAGGRDVRQAVIEPETIVTSATQPNGPPLRSINIPVPYAAIAGSVLADAVVASEDRGFRRHHGLDLPRLAIAPLAGGGGSTITMQVARMNVLQDRARTVTRKVNEIGVAMAIERVHSKDAILTAYINSVYLGVSRGRSVHGFGAAAWEFFGVRDLRQLTDLQAATLAALLNQPSRYLDSMQAGDPSRLQRQRNRVLRLMQRNFPQRYSEAWVRQREDLPVVFTPPETPADALHRMSRHFMDFAAPDLAKTAGERVYLTLDPTLQRLATEALEQGLTSLETRLPGWVRRPLQGTIIVTRPKTGDVLAMVGGRSYDASQFNRAVSASRQVGSVMKPFVFLAALEHAVDNNAPASPDSLVVDERTTFDFPGRRSWTPANYTGDYAGRITWRRALAESRNVPTVKIAAATGFDRIAALWRRASGQRLDTVHPSIALGAVEATPADVALAYSMFANEGHVVPLRAVTGVTLDDRLVERRPAASRAVARPDTTAVVTDMMRSVFDQGTARSARAAGFAQEAAGKTGTTDDLRDAWFVGFSGDLLAVVWVGRDDGQSIGLSGAQAALPIWTHFMTRALGGAEPAER